MKVELLNDSKNREVLSIAMVVEIAECKDLIEELIEYARAGRLSLESFNSNIDDTVDKHNRLIDMYNVLAIPDGVELKRKIDENAVQSMKLRLCPPKFKLVK